MKKKIIGLFVVLFIGFSIFAYSKLTFFVVQPIGAIPNGVTAVIWRKGNLNFIDSPDSLCLRTSGSVSLMCRSVAIGAAVNNNEIILRLPYSKKLYLISTNGQEFVK